jgi:hypothetical protein
MDSKSEEILFLKKEINYPKSDLIIIMNKLESVGAKKQANQLGNIIGRLESFQIQE